MLRLTLLGLLSLAMTGCAVQRPMYSWGNYEPMLYASYKDPTKANEMRLELETQISETERLSQKVPPGLYAELGTIYLQAGDSNKAVDLYSKERSAWPESRGMMGALIKNLERRQTPSAEVVSK